ncbi:hypothetical protein ACRHK7_01130 [Weissella tructae]|uniref:hypothetical protein n=1 Tax=Weissella tructae TaxID=887702 RepID=UPI003D8EE888
MRFNAVIYLAEYSVSEDDLGQQIKVPGNKRKVYANEFSVSRAEFSAAGEHGMRPSIAYQINTLDYQSEEIVFVGNEKLHVYRTNKVGDKITLYLEKVVGDGHD